MSIQETIVAYRQAQAAVDRLDDLVVEAERRLRDLEHLQRQAQHEARALEEKLLEQALTSEVQ